MSTELQPEVVKVLSQVLGIEDRVADLTASTPLFGSMAELDSLAVVELATALEEHFDILIEDEEFTGDIFETVGSLTEFVESKVERSAG